MNLFSTLVAQISTDPAQTDMRLAGILLMWSVIGLSTVLFAWPRGAGRRLVRQILSMAVLGFREGLRVKMLWTVALIAFIPGLLAYFSDADGTHVGRARVILNVCLTCGEVLGAAMIVLLASLSVSREIESRIMHTLGTKPMPRWGILLGKALGFWCIDLLFLAGLVLYAAILVRMVPLRPETRAGTELISTGTWADLNRNALVTRNLQMVEGDPDKAIDKFIKPGASVEQQFTISGNDSAEPASLRFLLSSTWSFDAEIRKLTIVAGYAGETPLWNKTVVVPQDRPFEIFLPPGALQRPGTLVVKLTAGVLDKDSPSVIMRIPGGVRLGHAADGFAMNLGKSLLLMALQGWILALIMTGWSGILSFPVSVALGLILILGGELSRQAVELMQQSSQMTQEMSGDPNAAAGSEHVAEVISLVLGLLPDFRAAGGPTAFVEGALVSAWAIAHAAFWMGLVRGLAWALPGVVMFQRREVGK